MQVSPIIARGWPPAVSSWLRRHLTISALIGVGAAAILLTMFHRHVVFSTLVDREERANVALARALANSLWPTWGGYISRAPALPMSELAARPETAALRAALLRKLEGQAVVKIKIYHPNGLVVFSTEPGQIGGNKWDNAGFQSARAGKPASAVVFRNQFLAFEGMVTDRNLVTSYVPVRANAAGPVEAVLELYSDVTPMVADLDIAGRKIIIGTFGVLVALYLVLMVFARRAGQVIARHEAERNAVHALVHHRAYHDPLTNLPNRASFDEQLDAAIRRARLRGHSMALLFIDVDGFKAINDCFGHAAGDELLRMVGSRLRESVRESDTVFRLGGDEFTILLEDIRSADDPVSVVQRMQSVMAVPARIANESLTLTLSVGMAISEPLGEARFDTLMHDADAAMYRAKRKEVAKSGGREPELRVRVGAMPAGSVIVN